MPRTLSAYGCSRSRAGIGYRCLHRPSPGLLPELKEAYTKQVNSGDFLELPSAVQGAMAHLNLVMIYPLADGNGRIGNLWQFWRFLAQNLRFKPI